MARLAYQRMNEARGYYLNQDYTRAAIEYESAEGLYSAAGEPQNARIAAKNKRQSRCYAGMKAWGDSADLLRDLRGETPSMGTLTSAEDKGVCREFPPAMNWMNNRISDLDAKQNVEEARQKAERDAEIERQQSETRRREQEARAREDLKKLKEAEQNVAACEAVYKKIWDRYPEKLPPWEPPLANVEETQASPEFTNLVGQMKNLFDFDWGDMEETCSKAGMPSDKSQQLVARGDDYEKRIVEREKTKSAERKGAIGQVVGGRQPVSCSAITDKDHLSSGSCEKGQGILESAREVRKENPGLAQNRYRRRRLCLPRRATLGCKSTSLLKPVFPSPQ
jgi:hypothetical protein